MRVVPLCAGAVAAISALCVHAAPTPFLEPFDGSFTNTWLAGADRFPITADSYLGAPTGNFTSLSGASVYRMSRDLSDRQKVGFSTLTVIDGLDTGGAVEARFNTLTQNSQIIDGLLRLSIINSTDSNRFVSIALFGGDFTATKVIQIDSSLGANSLPYAYANDTWYRLRIAANGPTLRASLFADDGTTELAGLTLGHSLSAIGGSFTIGIEQHMGTPGGTRSVDVAVDSVRTFVVPEPTIALPMLLMTATLRGRFRRSARSLFWPNVEN